jgi:vitamin B12 transporter
MHFDNGLSNFGVVYYRNRVTDLLITSSSCPPGYTFGCASNVNEALLTGLSFNAGTKLGNDFRLKGTLDLQDPRDETSDKLLARRSKVHGTVGIDYASGKMVAGADVFFSGYRFDDSANTAAKRLPGYALLNLHASYSLDKDWQVFGRWNNVFDRFYEQAYGYQTAGSNLFVGVRYGFN